MTPVLHATVERLLAVAKLATPGPWVALNLSIHGHAGKAWVVDATSDGRDTQVCDCDDAEADAAYIASANPATITTVCEALLAMEGELRTWQTRHLDPRIRTRCPSCGNDTLFIAEGGHLTCSWLECKSPGLERYTEQAESDRAALEAKLTEVTKINRERGRILSDYRAVQVAVMNAMPAFTSETVVEAFAALIADRVALAARVEGQARRIDALESAMNPQDVADVDAALQSTPPAPEGGQS